MNKQNSTKTKAISVFLAFLILFSSCASSTMIESSPSGAKVYINGESVGETPYKHRDTKIVGSNNAVKLEKEGFQTFETYFSRNEEADVGAIIGGIFFLVPFLWTMKYKPTHSYELTPLDPQKNLQTIPTTGSKAQKLRELKQLLDDKIITQEEFEIEKKKILEGGGND